MVWALEFRNATISTHRAIAFIAGCGLAVGCGGGTVVAQASGGGASGGSQDGGTGGASGSGGFAGLSAGGSAGDAGGPSAGCVDVSHVGALQKKDLQVIGSGFDAYEGLTIRVLATLGKPAFGLGEAPIEGGAFDILLPGVLGDYTALAVYVDRVRDDACNPDREFIWQQVTGPMSAWGPGYSNSGSGGAIWKVTPDTLRVFDQVGPCDLNGIFDLTIRLPCPAGT